jgi:excinuclease UvrABC ATPase subunit
MSSAFTACCQCNGIGPRAGIRTDEFVEDQTLTGGIYLESAVTAIFFFQNSEEERVIFVARAAQQVDECSHLKVHVWFRRRPEYREMFRARRCYR